MAQITNAIEQDPPPQRNLFRVNYYRRGQPATADVIAFSGSEASAFLGVRDGSATAHATVYGVEVAGIDPAHPAIPVPAPPPPPVRPLTADETKRLRELLNAKHA